MYTAPFHSLTDKTGPIEASILIVIFLTLLAMPQAHANGQTPSPLDEMAKQLALQLNANLVPRPSPPPKTLVVNIVDVGQLHCTSRFGQIMPERLRIYLQEMGWRIVEARRGLAVKLQENVGQFNLSDNVKDIAKRVNCQAVLAGTYLFHMGKIMINLRLIHLQDNDIISAAAAEADAGPWISTLLNPVGIGCRAPKAFLKIAPWPQRQANDATLDYSTKEERIDDYTK